MTATPFDWQTRVALLPHAPGVYLMKDRRGRIFYIGKANDLQARVRSYFARTDDRRPFVALLDRLLGDIDTVVTRSGKEALLLENHLVKLHQPRFNVRLRDDKRFLLLRLNLGETYPRIEAVRRREHDKAAYFGPYDSARAIRRTQRFISALFQLRACKDSVFRHRTRPCLLHGIGRCLGPCTLPVAPELYAERVAKARLLLEGRIGELGRQLEAEMWAASNAQDFERAARLRDTLQAVRRSSEKQVIDIGARRDIDTLGLQQLGRTVTLVVVLVREGLVTEVRSFHWPDQVAPADEILGSFFTMYYEEQGRAPEEVLLPLPLDDLPARAQWLSELTLRPVRVRAPRTGAGRRLIDLAARNAAEKAAERARADGDEGLAERLQRRLRLPVPPEHIECYDISTTQGGEPVGARVAFVGGSPAKAQYRHYAIRDVAGQDDFAMLSEVLRRRFAPAEGAADPPPDLVVIDGGRGQLNAALRVLAELGLGELPAVGLAKSRPGDPGAAAGAGRPKPERLFLPGAKTALVLPERDPGLRLLQRLRDEAHRFAVSYHRKRRSKARLNSALDAVPGIGPARRRALLNHFGSLTRLAAAAPADIAAVPGLPARLADRIHAWLHPERGGDPQADDSRVNTGAPARTS